MFLGQIKAERLEIFRYIRRTNNDAISKGHVSDGLSVRLGNGTSSDTGRDLRRESGTELSTDKGKSADNQSGFLGEDADNRGVKGKASHELDVDSEDYRNFGWVRANNVINAGYWRNFTENFA